MKAKRWLLTLVAAIMFLVPSCNTVANHPPIISNLIVESEIVLASASCQIECVASDEDGDGLNYQWSANGGDIDADGSTAVWVAPQSGGVYTITVRATDGNGRGVRDSLDITVNGNHAPIITSLKAGADLVAPAGSCQVECIASDTDGDKLSYEWSISGGDIDVDGSTAVWTAPNSEGIYTIVVGATDGNGGKVSDSLTITVKGNHLPIITSLKAGAGWVVPADSCQVECIASDADGDELSYEWSASGGDISGTGRIATWIAPGAEGSYDIMVKVMDALGNKTTGSLSISVASDSLSTDNPPTIKRLIVTPEDPKYCRELPWESWYRVFKGQSCEIECIASDRDGDELSYEWSTDGGSVSGKGSVIVWTSPYEDGDITITVTVSDGSGGIVSRDMFFRVDCSACMFR